MSRRDESRHDFAFLAGIIIGAIAGAIVTLVLAPGSGNETREKLRGKMQEFDVDTVRQRAMDARETVKERAGEQAERLKEMKDQAPAVSDLAATAKSKASNLADRAPIGRNGDSMADAIEDKVDDLTNASLADKAKDKVDDLTGRSDTEKVKDAATDLADEARDKTEDAADKAQDKAEDLADDAQDKAEDVADDAKDAADELDKKADQARRDAERSTTS